MTEKQMALEEAETEHSRQLATLGRKLSETEAGLELEKERAQTAETQLAEAQAKANEAESSLMSAHSQLAEVQQVRDQLQVNLESATTARDHLQEEFNSVQAQFETVQNTAREQESRLGSLEALSSQLEAKLSHAVEKMTRDAAVMERVRKAMAIGLGLLEHQEGDEPEDADDLVEQVQDDAE